MNAGSLLFDPTLRKLLDKTCQILKLHQVLAKPKRQIYPTA